ncbi:hypothetical protein S245_025600 [Arachis hypogaea]
MESISHRVLSCLIASIIEPLPIVPLLSQMTVVVALVLIAEEYAESTLILSQLLAGWSPNYKYLILNLLVGCCLCCEFLCLFKFSFNKSCIE